MPDHDYLIDASSILHLWKNYPINQFPKLWEWMGNQINQDRIMSIDVILDEVIDDACLEWFNNPDHKIKHVDISENEKIAEAQRIKQIIGIQGELRLTGKGIGDNDLELIATASLSSRTVITEESVQASEPIKPIKYKIPLVCKKAGIKFIHFLELIKSSQKIF